MPILLKEITLRYAPKGEQVFQILKDYYAVFGLWQSIQTGGIVNQRKEELINDVIHQVGKMAYEKISKRLSEMDGVWKEKVAGYMKAFNHAARMEDWTNFTAALSDIAKNSSTLDRTGELANLWRDAKNTDVSPSLWALFGGRPEEPKKPEPKWKAYDRPITNVPSAIQRDLPLPMAGGPMAGGQMDLPLKPGEKLPQISKDLPPLSTGMASAEPKQVGDNWAQLLNGFGYNWNEADKAYRNDARNVMIQVFPDNSATATLPSGKQKEFKNLGLLLRALGHNKRKRHAGEPAAQIVQENYKGLYEFLYT